MLLSANKVFREIPEIKKYQKNKLQKYLHKITQLPI